MGNSTSLKIEPADPLDRLTEIGAILGMTQTARDNALRLDLKFEAYLLDMAAIALSEQLGKTQEFDRPNRVTGRLGPCNHSYREFPGR